MDSPEQKVLNVDPSQLEIEGDEIRIKSDELARLIEAENLNELAEGTQAGVGLTLSLPTAAR